MNLFDFEIVTPTRVVFSGKVRHVRAPGSEGYFGVLSGHTPFMTNLQIGEIKINTEAAEDYYATSGGLIEVLPHGITVLAESAEKAGEIEPERAQKAIERAKKRLEEKTPDTDLDRARLALLRGINRIRISKNR